MVLFKLVKLSLKVIIIRQIADLLETGIIETITPEREMTVGDLLKELNLEGKYFTVIDKDSSITILPHIAGG